MSTPTHHGACHCGRVTFELEGEVSGVMECNCSLCRRVGALWIGASEARLRITRGEDDLMLYQFGTGTAKHYTCRVCGVHPFTRPRLDPRRWAVNARCIDALNLDELPRRLFDGANWEMAAEAFRPPRA